MNALVTIERPALPAELIAPLKLAADFAKASKAPATQAAYGSDSSHRCGGMRLPGRRGGRWKASQHVGTTSGSDPIFPPRCWLRHAHR